MRASLIKAMVVHSGQPTSGYCNKRLDCYPHDENHFYYEGHGRVQLDRVLHYDGESDFELYMYYSQVNSNKESFTLEFTITDISLEFEYEAPSLSRFEALQGYHGLHRSAGVDLFEDCHCEYCGSDRKHCGIEHVSLS